MARPIGRLTAELVIVFVGVLIALLVENWRENLVDRRDERIVLTGLASGPRDGGRHAGRLCRTLPVHLRGNDLPRGVELTPGPVPALGADRRGIGSASGGVPTLASVRRPPDRAAVNEDGDVSHDAAEDHSGASSEAARASGRRPRAVSIALSRGMPSSYVPSREFSRAVSSASWLRKLVASAWCARARSRKQDVVPQPGAQLGVRQQVETIRFADLVEDRQIVPFDPA